MPVQIEKIARYGWPNCYRVSNDEVELILTSDVGPRIMHYGFHKGKNMFAEIPQDFGGTNEKQCTLRGGSRIWVAPEDRSARTYAIDNSPVQIESARGVLTAAAPVEPKTGLQKQMKIRMAPSGSTVEVIHKIRNASDRTQALSLWVITMMAKGGVGITGFPPRGTHPEVLPPTHPLVMWAFTDLSDKRWKYTSKYLILRQDQKIKSPQKLGHFNPHTWGAYLLRDNLFLKRYKALKTGVYPDFGCSFEMFTNDTVLELETLSPMHTLLPGESVSHTEIWSLHSAIRISKWSDDELDHVLLPLLG